MQACKKTTTPNGVAVLLQNFISVHHNGMRCFLCLFLKNLK
nr:MAG TPA: hypothetical protein [Caudoviricetes sp.]